LICLIFPLVNEADLQRTVITPSLAEEYFT
jgi:hypothetical protein